MLVCGNARTSSVKIKINGVLANVTGTILSSPYGYITINDKIYSGDEISITSSNGSSSNHFWFVE